MNLVELDEYLKDNGYTPLKVDRYKNHDALYYSRPPQITYARLQLTCRVEEVPDSTWINLFGPKEKFVVIPVASYKYAGDRKP